MLVVAWDLDNILLALSHKSALYKANPPSEWSGSGWQRATSLQQHRDIILQGRRKCVKRKIWRSLLWDKMNPTKQNYNAEHFQLVFLNRVKGGLEPTPGSKGQRITPDWTPVHIMAMEGAKWPICIQRTLPWCIQHTGQRQHLNPQLQMAELWVLPSEPPYYLATLLARCQSVQWFGNHETFIDVQGIKSKTFFRYMQIGATLLRGGGPHC